jgi:hypothetical protein
MAKKMISLEISDDLREALRIMAFKESINISALIRRILEESLCEILAEVKASKEDKE